MQIEEYKIDVNNETKMPLKYNTKDSLLNPYFIIQEKLDIPL
jgi:hypothetical protein